MTWQELVRDQISKLEKEEQKTRKKLEKIRDNYSPNNFSKKLELEADIKSITESISTLYIILGRESEVTE